MDPKLVLQQMIVIMILIWTGFICQKIGRANDQNKKFCSFLVINIYNPCLLISSVLNQSSQRDYTSIFVMFIAATCMFIIFIIAGCIASFFVKSHSDKVTLKLMFIFSNLGFIGLPVIKAVLGNDYVIYNAIFNLVYNVIFYTYAVSLTNETKVKIFSCQTLKNIFSTGTIGGITAITLFFLNISLPQIISQSLNYLGNVCVPMALFIIGITLGEQKHLSKIFTNMKLYTFFAIKMILIPVILCFVIKAAPMSEELKYLTLLMVSMPVGSLPLLILAEKGWDCSFCSNGIIITTILSVVTLPLIALFFVNL